MPNSSFLQSVIAFEAAIMGIAYPVTLDIVSRISDRYESNVIGERFSEEVFIKLLPPVALGHIVFSCLLLFFIKNEDALNITQTLLLWSDFLSFIFVILLFIQFLMTARKYVVSREVLIKDLLKDLDEFLK